MRTSQTTAHRAKGRPGGALFVPRPIREAIGRALEALQTPKGRGRTAAMVAAAKASGMSDTALYRYLDRFLSGGWAALADRPRRGSARDRGTNGRERAVLVFVNRARAALDEIERLIAGRDDAVRSGGDESNDTTAAGPSIGA